MKNSDFISKKKKKKKKKKKEPCYISKKKKKKLSTRGVKPSSLTYVLQILIMIKEMLRSQYFYNKSQMVRNHWFKFKPNTKIIFLPQQ